MMNPTWALGSAAWVSRSIAGPEAWTTLERDDQDVEVMESDIDASRLEYLAPGGYRTSQPPEDLALLTRFVAINLLLDPPCIHRT